MAINLRDEENAKRKQRLAQIKRGPGVFVYAGTAVDTEWVPTILRTRKASPAFGADGLPVFNEDGEQVFEKAGKPVRDSKGNPVLGGPPKKLTHKIEVFKIRGLEFPEGEPVKVSDPSLALKLRCMSHFDEVAAGTEVETEPAPKKRGRSKKPEVETETETDA
jgi:hypothetical protein